MKRIILIRPGETDWNRLGRWQGQVAIPLNSHGRLQARRLADFVQLAGVGALYSSDLRRARDTAEIISARLGIQPIYDVRLRERHMGDWQGMTLAEIQSWCPEEYEKLVKNPDNFQIPGGESRRQVAKRTRAAFDDILARGGAETIGVISHTTAFRTLLADLIAGTDPYALRFANMSVTTLTRDKGGHWTISQLNDVSHLEGIDAMDFPEVESKP